MQTRKLGRDGPEVPLVGIGCNNFGGRITLEAARAVTDRAIELGAILFDTADAYGTPNGASEEMLAEALGPRRKAIFLATKFGSAMGGPPDERRGAKPYIMKAAEASLRRLKTDYIDLYQLHRPDPNTPLEETLDALDALVTQGKVRFIGCSNVPAADMAAGVAKARAKGGAAFVCSQDEYSLMARGAEKELIPALLDQGMGLLPYSPLASGLLSGKYKRGEPPPEGTRFAKTARSRDRFMTDANMDKAEALEAFAKARGHSLLELAFSWLAAQPVISCVIAGATSAEQVSQNVAAVGWALSLQELAEIDRIAA